MNIVWNNPFRSSGAYSKILAACLLALCWTAAPIPALALQGPSAPAPQAAPASPATPNAPNANDIHDIRGPISIPYVWMLGLYVLGGLVILGGLVVLLMLLLKRDKIVKARPAHEIALEKLKAIRPLMHPDQAREFSFGASEIIREYIEAQFGVLAARHTTEEFLRQLLDKADSPLVSHRPQLEEFLKYCDLAKFARWQLSERDMDSMYDSARDFILATLPGLEALGNKSTASPQPAASEPSSVATP